jgi:predicted transcriptional regulator
MAPVTSVPAVPAAIAITQNEVIEALAAAVRAATGDGMTVSEMVEATGWPRSKVLKALKTLRAQGMLRTQEVWRESIDGRTRPVPGYRIVAPER